MHSSDINQFLLTFLQGTPIMPSTSSQDTLARVHRIYIFVYDHWFSEKSATVSLYTTETVDIYVFTIYHCYQLLHSV